MLNVKRVIIYAIAPFLFQACNSGSVTNDTVNNNPNNSVGDAGAQSILADAANQDIGGNALEFAPFCNEEPFASDTSGTYQGVIANEIFSEFSRCEFDITLTIKSPASDNQSCEQTGVLGFIGTQTVISDFPSICGSIENQEITISWNLHDYTHPVEDGSQIQLVRDIGYPLEAVVSSWGIERFPEENDQGVQIEYPGVLFSFQMAKDLTITGGDADLYTGILTKVE